MNRQNGENGRTERTGDWRCVCGQEYRVHARRGELTMWPRNSADGYRVESIGDECVCGAHISRGTVLSGLFGATVSV